MSSYYSDSEINQYEEENQNELFRFDTSLIGSIDVLNTWKQRIGLSTLEYLNKEVQAVQNDYDLFSCGNQVRAIAFCHILRKGFNDLIKKYTHVYLKVVNENFDIAKEILQIDKQLIALVRHLQLVQANNAVIELYNEIQQDFINQIYENLRKAVDYCFDLNTLWLTLLTPKMFREDLKQNLYKVNYGGTLLYYQKQLSYLHERVKRAQIKDFSLNPKSQSQVIKNIALIINNQKLKPNLKTKIISLLKGQFYANKQNKTLKQQFIISSMQMYNGEQVSQIWDYERYQNLCLETLKKSLTDEQYLDCILYMEPQNISFERRKRTVQFAEIYYALINKLLNINKKQQMQQQKTTILTKINIPDKFLEQIMKAQNIQLICHLFVNFLISNKNAFSMNIPQLDKLLFGILQGMKQIYLSFGTLTWHISICALSALTNRLFCKFSEDMKDQIMNILPMMVKHLGEDKLPTRPYYVTYQQKQVAYTKCQIKIVTRPQLLSAIFYYIKDCEYRDQDFYLDLGQVNPTNLQTAIMFIKSLQLKLRHHQPTQDQKKLWTMIIEQAINHYKVKVNLKWYKPKKRFDIQQRQAQYMMHKQLKQKWAHDLVQKILNFRDDQKYNEVVNTINLGQIAIQSEIINYFKYAVGLRIGANRWSSYIQDYDIFMLLQKMRTLLDINYGDIINLAFDQLITLNQLHLSLMFYNTKIQEAPGNQNYMLIVHKIIVPWFQISDQKQCQKFKQQFQQFFTNYIWRDYYLTIGDSLIKFLSEQKGIQNLQYKLDYYTNNLNVDVLKKNQIENTAQFLQKIYSIVDYNTSVSVIIKTMQLVLKFMQLLPQLEDQYISLGFFIDFLDKQHKIQIYMKAIEEFSYGDRRRLNIQLIKKLPEKLDVFNTNQIFRILQNYIDSEQDNNDPLKLLKILDQIPKNKNNLHVMCIKALLAQKHLQKIILSLGDKPDQKKQQQMKYFKYWKQLQNYVKQNAVQRKKQDEQVNLAKICQIFQQTVFKKLKQDYKRILHIENKKKSSQKKKSCEADKSSMSQNQKKQQQNKLKEIQFGDKHKQAKIWRKVVRNFGTFQDIILFGEDPLELAGSQQQQIYDQCLKIIQKKTIQQKYLKRIIRKLPILQKCAEQAVKKITSQQNKQSQHIQPQFLCKLIMINSRYRSKIVQNFILANISKIPIPVKIYQDYLVFDIKKKLQNSPKNIIQKMLYEQLTIQDMRKIDQIFDQLIYMPIKKFENVYLKFQNKIQQNQQVENQEWETQSQGKNDKDQQQEQQTNLQKKKSKKKQQKKQSIQEQNQVNMQPNQDDLNNNQNMNQNMFSDQDDDDQDGQQNSDDMDEEQNHQQIVNMFYQQNDNNLPKYKLFVHLREQLNIAFESNYLNFQNIQKKLKNDPQLQKKVFKIVDILQNQISQKQIVIQILNKTPQNLYKIFKNYGLTVQRNEQKVVNYRKQVTKMPNFMKDNVSQRDQNSQNQDQYNQDQDVYDNDDDDLSQQTNSNDDMFDGFGDQMLFAINQQGQLQQINSQDIGKNQDIDSDDLQQNQSEQNKMVTNLQKQTDDTLTLPQLKQINSKIQLELTGKQLSADQIVRIMEIAIVKLFSLHVYQLKQKPVMSFYSDILNSKQGKIFIDSVFTVLRVDQLYTDQKRFTLAKKLRKAELSLSKALNNLLEIAIQIATQQSKQGDQLGALIRDQVRALLPIGEQIVVKSDIPVQDHLLTLLIFYARYNQNNIHEKTKRLLTTLYEDGKNSYQLTKAKATTLTKHIYLNNNSSSIWNNIQERFGVKIDKKIKFTSCLVVYGQLLRQDIQKCYNDLLQIVKIPIEVHNEQQKKQAKLLIKQQQKKVQQNLKKHFKRIKHYYYWNKRIILEEFEDQNKPIELLKNKQLIKLTQLMIFYCHFLKQRFFEKIDGSAMKNLLVLPKSVIQVSFMFLWKLQAKIDKWQPLSKVKQYFKSLKLYQHKFNRLQQVCNLVLEFLQMPQFSNSKFKQVIIPYFINNPQMAHQIPLIFKLPDIPEQLNGQKVYLTRQCSFDMSFYQLVSKSISVEFHNQQGSDHGGMVREFMMGWTGVGIGQQAVFLGKILAISFKKSIPFGGDFDIAMAVAITQHKITIEFFENVDPQIYRNLKYIRDNDPQDLQVRFQIPKQQYGIMKSYPLIPNGSQIPVTNQNKQKYIQLFLANYFTIGRQWQLSQLCAGFFSIVNKKYASIFSPFEMIQKIQGQQIQDYTKLKNKTKYEQGYTETSQMIKWFWQIVSSFNQKQMNKFLQFITGAPKVSIYNHNFSFVIQKPYGENQDRLPVAHTCFNTLQLPQYKTKQILQKKLTQAIYQGNDSFGIL